MSDKKLSGLHAVITGASSGLGLVMTRALLQEGAKVAMASRPGDKLIEAVKQCQNEGLAAVGLPLDVRSEQSIADAANWVGREWGKIDLLVNNAGIGMRTVNPRFMFDPQPFYQVSSQGFRDVIETNLYGYFFVSRAFVPLMIAQGRGRIVNISMNHATMKRKGFNPYGPSRAAAEALSYIMAEDLRDCGITVNILLPGGATDTGLIPEEYRDEIKKTHSLLNAEVMAAPIVFLASPEAEGLTGERIVGVEFHKWLEAKGIGGLKQK